MGRGGSRGEAENNRVRGGDLTGARTGGATGFEGVVERALGGSDLPSYDPRRVVRDAFAQALRNPTQAFPATCREFITNVFQHDIRTTWQLVIDNLRGAVGEQVSRILREKILYWRENAEQDQLAAKRVQALLQDLTIDPASLTDSAAQAVRTGVQSRIEQAQAELARLAQTLAATQAYKRNLTGYSLKDEQKRASEQAIALAAAIGGESLIWRLASQQARISTQVAIPDTLRIAYDSASARLYDDLRDQYRDEMPTGTLNTDVECTLLAIPLQAAEEQAISTPYPKLDRETQALIQQTQRALGRLAQLALIAADAALWEQHVIQNRDAFTQAVGLQIQNHPRTKARAAITAHTAEIHERVLDSLEYALYDALQVDVGIQDRRRMQLPALRSKARTQVEEITYRLLHGLEQAFLTAIDDSRIHAGEVFPQVSSVMPNEWFGANLVALRRLNLPIQRQGDLIEEALTAAQGLHTDQLPPDREGAYIVVRNNTLYIGHFDRVNMVLFDNQQRFGGVLAPNELDARLFIPVGETVWQHFYRPVEIPRQMLRTTEGWPTETSRAYALRTARATRQGEETPILQQLAAIAGQAGDFQQELYALGNTLQEPTAEYHGFNQPVTWDFPPQREYELYYIPGEQAGFMLRRRLADGTVVALTRRTGVQDDEFTVGTDLPRDARLLRAGSRPEENAAQPDVFDRLYAQYQQHLALEAQRAAEAAAEVIRLRIQEVAAQRRARFISLAQAQNRLMGTIVRYGYDTRSTDFAPEGRVDHDTGTIVLIDLPTTVPGIERSCRDLPLGTIVFAQEDDTLHAYIVREAPEDEQGAYIRKGDRVVTELGVDSRETRSRREQQEGQWKWVYPTIWKPQNFGSAGLWGTQRKKEILALLLPLRRDVSATDIEALLEATLPSQK